jgi:hypothetical protein
MILDTMYHMSVYNCCQKLSQSLEDLEIDKWKFVVYIKKDTFNEIKNKIIMKQF